MTSSFSILCPLANAGRLGFEAWDHSKNIPCHLGHKAWPAGMAAQAQSICGLFHNSCRKFWFCELWQAGNSLPTMIPRGRMKLDHENLVLQASLNKADSVTEEQLTAIIHRALELGVSHMDTSDSNQCRANEVYKFILGTETCGH